ncbi:SCO family protein [Trichlorobacter lovleyi]|uniref:SCO family protein n=1 Tax=Trichlorobacter lovleyi TaxID=313985 RepID=UPI003D099C17
MLFRTVLTLLLLSVCGMAVVPTAALAGDKKYKRSVEHYTVPNVVLINQDGKKVRLQTLLSGNEPLILDFIYGTCTTICPVLSAGFANLQNRLAIAGQTPRLISITIDPENDSPRVMRDYLKRYRAKPGWTFLTGSRSDIDKTMHAFNAYIPDKMSHYPLNLIRSPRDGAWIRLFGIMSSSELMEEYKQVVGK